MLAVCVYVAQATVIEDETHRRYLKQVKEEEERQRQLASEERWRAKQRLNERLRQEIQEELNAVMQKKPPQSQPPPPTQGLQC